MCRNIKTLFNFDPPATHAEIHASALQFVRKLSGFNSPSQANAEAFNRAVSEVSDSARRLLAVAADQRCAARPRGRGREGEGTLAGAVRLGRDRRKRSDRSPPNTGEGCSKRGRTDLSTYRAMSSHTPSGCTSLPPSVKPGSLFP